MESLSFALQPPDPRLSIRPVEMTDTGQLHAICWPDRPYIAIYQLVARAVKYMRQRRGLGVVVEVDGYLRAFGQLTLWPRGGEISDLMVAENYRSRGIGAGMIQYLIQAAIDMRVPNVEIGAAFSNPRALELYRRLGFLDDRTVMMNLGNGRESVLYLRIELPRRLI
jgi:ribosomal protein S18 acetylase RimI-like enzyme